MCKVTTGCITTNKLTTTGLHSAVGNVSGVARASRSGPILSWRLVMKQFLPSADSRRVVVSYKQKYVHKLIKYWLTA